MAQTATEGTSLSKQQRDRKTAKDDLRDPRNLRIDRSIDRSLSLSKGGPTPKRVVKVIFLEDLNLLVLSLKDGDRVVLKREDLQFLSTASSGQVRHTEILPGGTAINWPDIDQAFSVQGLIEGRFGTARWMADLGRRGGSVVSEAKARAARLNGSKGGRPKLVGGGDVKKAGESLPQLVPYRMAALRRPGSKTGRVTASKARVAESS